MVDIGATAIWESWNGYTKDGKATGSHSHYPVSAIASWFREGIGDISPYEPGCRAIKAALHVGCGFTHANTSVETLVCVWDNQVFLAPAVVGILRTVFLGPWIQIWPCLAATL